MSTTSTPPTAPPPRSPHDGRLDDELLGLEVSYPAPRVALLSVSGEIDTLTSELLTQRAATLLTERPDLIIDLSEVRFLGSGGLQTLISTHHRAETSHGQLHVVTGGHRVVTRPITLTALDRVLRLHPDLQAALDALPDTSF